VLRLSSPRLVGREAELALLGGLLVGSRGGCAVVVGEPGIGKSRLVREFASSTREAGFVMLFGRAVEAAEPIPYRPLAEALVSACRRGGVPNAAELAPYRPVLGRIIPEWAGADVVVSRESTVALGEGVLRMLRVLGGQCGAVLVVEDLQWCDPDTAAVLEYVADHAAEEAVRVVATTRPPSRGPGGGLVRSLVDRRVASVIELSALAVAEVRELAAACLGVPTLPAGLDEVLERGEGVPFLIEELLAAAVSCGAMRPDGSGWVVTPQAAAVVPATFVEDVARRLAALGADERLVASAAALLGRRVDIGVLGELFGRAPPDLAPPLDRCVAVQLLMRDLGGYSFRHALTRDAVLAGVAAPVRADLARRARVAVEAVHPGLPGPWCQLAADLDHAAGDAAGAAATLVAAARRALDAGALTTAAAVLDRAARLASRGSRVAGAITELRIEAAAAAGDVDAAFGLAAGSADDLHAPGLARGERARVHLRLADAANAAARWPEAMDQLAAAAAMVDGDEQRAVLDVTRAYALMGMARSAEAEPLARRALAEGERLELIEVVCRGCELLGRIARNRDLGVAQQMFVRLLDVAATSGRTLWAARAAHELGTIGLIWENRIDQLVRARDLALQCGAISTAATVELQLTGSAWMSLDAMTLLAASQRCQRLARRSGLQLVLGEALQAEAGAHAISGDRAAMEQAISQTLATSVGPALRPSSHSHRAMYALLREQRYKALGLYEETVAMDRAVPAVYVRPYWYLWSLLRTVADDRGDQARAEARAKMQAGPLPTALIEYGDAVAAGRRGRGDDARSVFDSARVRLRAPGWAAQRHLAERLVAECALADGWGEPVDWLTDGAAYFQKAGHRQLEQACRSLLRRAGVSLPRREHGRSGVPDALASLGVTTREAEILRLVADGLTSREIAGRLYISVRTVDKHVEHLIAKTGVSRRAELHQFAT
jgi:DNA-binding CsgD family transcriptional regulator